MNSTTWSARQGGKVAGYFQALGGREVELVGVWAELHTW